MLANNTRGVIVPNMSNTAEAKVSFVRDIMLTARHFEVTPLLGAAVGFGIGREVENKVSNADARSNASNQITVLQQDNKLAVNWSHAAKKEGNTSAQTFLNQIQTSTSKQIISKISSEPKPPGTFENVAFSGCGALIGALALTAHITVLRRSKSRMTTKANSLSDPVN